MNHFGLALRRWAGKQKVNQFGLAVRRWAGKQKVNQFGLAVRRWAGKQKVNQFGLAVRRWAGKQKDVGSILFSVLLSVQMLRSVDTILSCDFAPHN